MPTEAYMRDKIESLFRENPTVHMDVSLTRPRLSLTNAEAKITGIYPHFFQIEESSQGFVRRHSLKYSEVAIGHIVIRELK